MVFSCLLLYHALRSFCFLGVHGSIFGLGVRHSERAPFPAWTAGAWRVAACGVKGNTACNGRWRCGEIGQTRGRGGESGADEAVEGEFRRREAERCAQVRSFCRKAPRFPSFYGDFCAKVSTFFFVLRFFAR